MKKRKCHLYVSLNRSWPHVLYLCALGMTTSQTELKRVSKYHCQVLVFVHHGDMEHCPKIMDMYCTSALVHEQMVLHVCMSVPADERNSFLCVLVLLSI